MLTLLLTVQEQTQSELATINIWERRLTFTVNDLFKKQSRFDVHLHHKSELKQQNLIIFKTLKHKDHKEEVL